MDRQTHTLDAKDRIAGRLASEIATLLQGKHKVSYLPHTDCGDIVEVQNVSKMKFSGKKLEKKVYHRFTGYPGGIITTRLSEMFAKRPELVLRKMVFNMLPDNKLRAKMIRRLRIEKNQK